MSDVALCKPSLFALTADNWLHRYELNSGKLLERVFLSPKFKFRLFYTCKLFYLAEICTCHLLF